MTLPSNPIYWSDLIAGQITKLSIAIDRRTKYVRVGDATLKQLQAEFAKTQRAVCKNSQSELADGFILDLMATLDHRPIEKLQVLHCLRTVWIKLHTAKQVDDLDFADRLNVDCHRLQEQIVFADWLSSWPVCANRDLQNLATTLLERCVCIQDHCQHHGNAERFWTIFAHEQLEIAKGYFRRGQPDMRKYTLQMTKKRFLKTAPIRLDSKVDWTKSDRAQKISAKKKNLRSN